MVNLAQYNFIIFAKYEKCTKNAKFVQPFTHNSNFELNEINFQKLISGDSTANINV
jgi:hypothetical protein